MTGRGCHRHLRAPPVPTEVKVQGPVTDHTNKTGSREGTAGREGQPDCKLTSEAAARTPPRPPCGPPDHVPTLHPLPGLQIQGDRRTGPQTKATVCRQSVISQRESALSSLGGNRLLFSAIASSAFFVNVSSLSSAKKKNLVQERFPLKRAEENQRFYRQITPLCTERPQETPPSLPRKRSASCGQTQQHVRPPNHPECETATGHVPGSGLSPRGGGPVGGGGGGGGGST